MANLNISDRAQSKTTAAPDKKDPVATASMWGSIAGAASSMFSTGANLAGMFNSDVRDAQVRIAEANATAAQANSGSAGKLFGIDKKYVFIGGGVLLAMIVLIIFLSNKKS